MHTLDPIAEILKEDLPHNANIYRQDTEHSEYLIVELWPKKYIVHQEDAHPQKFECRIANNQLVIHRIKHPNTITGPSFCFELADPNCFKQIYTFFAKECLL
jgi:hypothetical protein